MVEDHRSGLLVGLTIGVLAALFLNRYIGNNITNILDNISRLMRSVFNAMTASKYDKLTFVVTHHFVSDEAKTAYIEYVNSLSNAQFLGLLSGPKAQAKSTITLADGLKQITIWKAADVDHISNVLRDTKLAYFWRDSEIDEVSEMKDVSYL